jgi:hypothetical protein
MDRLTNRGGPGVVGVGFSIVVLALLPGACAQQSPTFEVDDFGVVPRPAVMRVLLGMESVHQDLGLTEAQKKELEEAEQRAIQKMQQARQNATDRSGLRTARDAAFKEVQEVVLAALKPEQRQRLDQIQLQAQGPLAFARGEGGPMAFIGPPLSERLKLTSDQVQRISQIEQAGETEIQKAASFPIAVDTKNGPPSQETIGKLVDSPEFQATKKKAIQAGRDATAAVTKRIEAVLTDAQREAYHKMLGQAFDLSTLRWGGQSDRQIDISRVAQGLGGGGGGGGGGQQADPSFDTKVARPAYADASRHPRVLFDEAHHNFHTSGGRYKPFASLMTSDGFQIIPNSEKFSREVLRKGDILVIANALGAEGMGQPEASNPAFTDAECEAVREWIGDGGALLLITDHAPMGSAAKGLAKLLGVDMSTGATSDPVNSSGGDTSLVFSRENHLLGDHPITRGRDDSERVNKIQTFTGTSLKGPEGSTAILKLADTAVDLSFGEGPAVSAAGRAQGLAFSLGKGRVVVMGEAAELSAQLIGMEKFGMNVPGIDNRQMALNIMRWLSGLLEPREGASRKAE